MAKATVEDFDKAEAEKMPKHVRKGKKLKYVKVLWPFELGLLHPASVAFCLRY